MKKFVLRIFHQSLMGLSNQGGEIGGACSKHGKEEKVRNFGRKGRNHLAGQMA